MAQQNSFDIVSQVDRAEITNAINQTVKEVRQRFDFKGSRADVVLEDKELVLSAEDETKMRNMNDILQQKLVTRVRRFAEHCDCFTRNFFNRIDECSSVRVSVFEQ